LEKNKIELHMNPRCFFLNQGCILFIGFHILVLFWNLLSFIELVEKAYFFKYF
jgi:hypothetical protein